MRKGFIAYSNFTIFTKTCILKIKGGSQSFEEKKKKKNWHISCVVLLTLRRLRRPHAAPVSTRLMSRRASE